MISGHASDRPSCSKEMNTIRDVSSKDSLSPAGSPYWGRQRHNSASMTLDNRDNKFTQSRYSMRSLMNLHDVEANKNNIKSNKLKIEDTIVTILDESTNTSTNSYASSMQALRSRNVDSKKGLKDNSSSNTNNRRYPLFNGLINEVRNRLWYYKTDITDAANFQCLTSLIFMFFACFAPSITFGGLMGKYTNETIGTTETLIAQCICGVIFGLFAAQPLLIMSPTGPVLIFEASLYAFCDHMDLDFLAIRFYTGAWIFAISICTAAIDGSRLLTYVTRFTEDIFATLISAIFIAESIHFIWHTFEENPVEDYEYYMKIHTNCQNSSILRAAMSVAENNTGALAAALTANTQLPGVARYIAHIETIKPFILMQIPFDQENGSAVAVNTSDLEAAAIRFAATLRHAKEGIEAAGGPVALAKIRICGDAEPNTALLTAFIMVATFSLALTFKRLRESFYFGKHIRRVIGDFGVLLAIVIVVVAVQTLVPDPYLQRLDMPDHLSFTNGERRGHGLFVIPTIDSETWLASFIALIAALLIFILLFVETEITELLISRRERGCRKGNGMNWDLVLMGFCALICSLLGLPWMCAAAVQSLAHCSSLTVMKKKAPGTPNEVDHVIEQRITTIGVSLLIGAIALGGSYLRMPLASLFGVFLYLGVMNLSGVQLVQRVVLFFIPEKYFPKTLYTEQVSIWRMHLYTWIQLMCLFIVYTVKYFKKTALAFPFVLALFIIFRQVIIPRIFTDKELKAVDGEEEEQDDSWMEKDFYEHSRIPI